jgi:hypothetical protein
VELQPLAIGTENGKFHLAGALPPRAGENYKPKSEHSDCATAKLAARAAELQAKA